MPPMPPQLQLSLVTAPGPLWRLPTPIIERQSDKSQPSTLQFRKAPLYFPVQVHFSVCLILRNWIASTRSAAQLLSKQACALTTFRVAEAPSSGSQSTIQHAKSEFLQYVCRLVDYDIHSPSQLPRVLLHHHMELGVLSRGALDDAGLYAR